MGNLLLYMQIKNSTNREKDMFEPGYDFRKTRGTVAIFSGWPAMGTNPSSGAH